MGSGYIILTIIAVSVFFITLVPSTSIERRFREQYGVARTWWVPPIALAVAGYLNVLTQFQLINTLYGKADILAVLLCLAMLAQGLASSGFFRYIGYKIVSACDGDTITLFLGSYIGISILTYLTTNDVVVLVTTPLIITICQQARIKEARLLLIVEFIAANTLSMGMFLGSPTNIIMAGAVGIDFIAYFRAMIIPTTLVFILTTLLVAVLIRLAFHLGYLQEEYEPIDDPEYEAVTHKMVGWLTMSFIALMGIRLTSMFPTSLLWPAFGAVCLFVGYRILSKTHNENPLEILSELPYGIFLFGFSFFALARALMVTPLLQDQVLPYLLHTIEVSPESGLFYYASGAMVNIFNDLPATTMIAELFNAADIGAQTFAFRAVMVGVNVGCYVTPIGALAGILFFSVINQHKRSRDEDDFHIRLPNKYHLIVLGLLFFFVVGWTTVDLLRYIY